MSKLVVDDWGQCREGRCLHRFSFAYVIWNRPRSSDPNFWETWKLEKGVEPDWAEIAASCEKMREIVEQQGPVGEE